MQAAWLPLFAQRSRMSSSATATPDDTHNLLSITTLLLSADSKGFGLRPSLTSAVKTHCLKRGFLSCCLSRISCHVDRRMRSAAVATWGTAAGRQRARRRGTGPARARQDVEQRGLDRERIAGTSYHAIAARDDLSPPPRQRTASRRRRPPCAGHQGSQRGPQRRRTCRLACRAGSKGKLPRRMDGGGRRSQQAGSAAAGCSRGAPRRLDSRKEKHARERSECWGHPPKRGSSHGEVFLAGGVVSS